MGNTKTITITRRTRLGYGCTSQVERSSSGLRIATPREEVRLTPRTLRARRPELLRAIGVTGGGSCDYREALFVNGARVVEPRASWLDALALLTTRSDGRFLADAVTVTVEVAS